MSGGKLFNAILFILKTFARNLLRRGRLKKIYFIQTLFLSRLTHYLLDYGDFIVLQEPIAYAYMFIYIQGLHIWLKFETCHFFPPYTVIMGILSNMDPFWNLSVSFHRKFVFTWWSLNRMHNLNLKSKRLESSAGIK